MPVTRQNDIGLAGRSPSSTVQGAIDGSPGRQQSAGVLSDPFVRQYVIELPLVASASEQDTGFTMPANAQSMSGFVRIKTASTGGTTEEIEVGIFGGTSDALLAATATTAVGILNTLQNVDLSGVNIGYTLGSADITGLEAELVLTVLASDD